MGSPEERPRMRGAERRPQPRSFPAGALLSFLLRTKPLSTSSMWLTLRSVAKPPGGHCSPSSNTSPGSVSGHAQWPSRTFPAGAPASLPLPGPLQPHRRAQRLGFGGQRNERFAHPAQHEGSEKVRLQKSPWSASPPFPHVPGACPPPSHPAASSLSVCSICSSSRASSCLWPLRELPSRIQMANGSFQNVQPIMSGWPCLLAPHPTPFSLALSTPACGFPAGPLPECPAPPAPEHPLPVLPPSLHTLHPANPPPLGGTAQAPLSPLFIEPCSPFSLGELICVESHPFSADFS